jgi:hypothetical protein
MTLRSAALARLIERTSEQAGEDRCDLCGVPLPDAHRHLLDLQDEQVRCVCRACALLFEREAATPDDNRLKPRHYRLVPERRIRLAPAEVETGVPVGLAFYVRQPDGQVTVRYPAPAGITTATVDPPAWSALTACWPELTGLVPAVEAFLVNTTRTSNEHWIVPIDDCYRLVALIRQHWTGLSGGRAVWPAVDSFFATLSRPAQGRMVIGTG